MKFGVLSDTHNHLAPTQRAFAALRGTGVHRIVHCGDAGPDALAWLARAAADARLPLFWAWGNCDFASESAETARYAPPVCGVTRADWQVDCSTLAKRCLALHGHLSFRLHALAASGNYDVIFLGHTHHPAAERVGETWLLNPGSPARPRGAPPTVMLYDDVSGDFTWLHLPDSP